MLRILITAICMILPSLGLAQEQSEYQEKDYFDGVPEEQRDFIEHNGKKYTLIDIPEDVTYKAPEGWSDDELPEALVH